MLVPKVLGSPGGLSHPRTLSLLDIFEVTQ